jgi:hypothetical protein
MSDTAISMRVTAECKTTRNRNFIDRIENPRNRGLKKRSKTENQIPHGMYLIPLMFVQSG